MSDASLISPVDEKLPVGRLATLGIQHVLVMYGGAVAVPLIVGRAPAEKAPPGRCREIHICRQGNS